MLLLPFVREGFYAFYIVDFNVASHLESAVPEFASVQICLINNKEINWNQILHRNFKKNQKTLLLFASHANLGSGLRQGSYLPLNNFGFLPQISVDHLDVFQPPHNHHSKNGWIDVPGIQWSED